MIMNLQTRKSAPAAEFNQIKTTKGNGNHTVADQQCMNQIIYHKNKTFLFSQGFEEHYLLMVYV